MSNQINDGGPAFGSGDATHGGFTGMSLRDYFAAQVIASVYAYNPNAETAVDYTDIADYAYELADAMIERGQR